MKGAFGLVGLLVVVGIVVYALGPGGGTNYVGTVVEKGQKAEQQVNQLAGNARDGSMSFKESITVDEQSANGRTVALLVNTIKPTGPAATYFGLKRGDLITEIGPLEIKTMDGDAGLDFLMDAYQKQGEITVMRDDQKIKLPGGQVVGAAPGVTVTPQPAAKPAPPKDDRGSLQRQLDNITEAGGKSPGGN